MTLSIHSADRYDMSSVTINRTTQLTLKDCDYQFHDMEQNAIRDICGYLIRKCINIHTCQNCVDFANTHQNLDETSLYSQFRACQTKTLDIFGNLYMPHDNIFYYVCELEQIFIDNFEKIALMENTLETFIELYKSIPFQHHCKNFPYGYLIRLYSRMRLFYSLKFINRNFRITGEGKKCKEKE